MNRAYRVGTSLAIFFRLPGPKVSRPSRKASPSYLCQDPFKPNGLILVWIVKLVGLSAKGILSVDWIELWKGLFSWPTGRANRFRFVRSLLATRSRRDAGLRGGRLLDLSVMRGRGDMMNGRDGMRRRGPISVFGQRSSDMILYDGVIILWP
jgi:hypothetical protein